jgi:phosphotransferase system IIB component
MLKQKALTRNLTATLCTTSNTLFIHNKKTVNKAAFVYTQNAQKVVRNLNAQQQAAFNNLAATYMQSAKQFIQNKLAQSTILKS